MPIKLTSTFEDDLIIKITKVKPGLQISRKDREHMVANTFFKVQMKCFFYSRICKSSKNQEDRRLPFLNISSSSRVITV